MKTAWGNDIEKFAPELTVSYAYAENRLEAFQMPTDVVIINTDGVKALTAKQFLKLLEGFDHLTIDEYTHFKHATSKRAKAMAAIRKFFVFRYGLSGTPNPRSVMELWHPMLIIDDGKRLGTSYYRLRSSVQTPTQVGPDPRHLQWDDKPGVAPVISELLKDVVIRHEFEEVMPNVPKNHVNYRKFDLSAKARKAYTKMENDFILALENGVANAVHAASLRTKLLQIASGAVYTAEGKYVVIDTARYELVADLIDSVLHNVVFFNWKHQRDLLCAEFEHRGYTFSVIDGSVSTRERDGIVQRYQDGEYKALLLHPRTGAHGLTLTKGTQSVFSSPIYEADIMKQAIHRIYRGGQTSVTNSVLVEAAGTVERAVYERMNGNYQRMSDLLELMKQSRS